MKRDRQTDRETGRQAGKHAGRQTGRRRNRPTEAERRTDWDLIRNSNREKWNDCGGGGGGGVAGEREREREKGVGDKTGTRTEKMNGQTDRYKDR